MKDSRKNLLQLIYNYDQTEGAPLQISADGSDIGYDSYTLRNDITYLKSNGYITEPLSILRTYTLALTEKGESFVENDFKMPSENPINNIFNIENATNSVIGMQSNVTLNVNDTIRKTREQIDSCDSDDKSELHQIITLLEMVINNQIPATKGLLSKFSAVIQRNSWIASPVTSVILHWLTTL